MTSLDTWLAIGAAVVNTALFFGLTLRALRSGNYLGFIGMPAVGVFVAVFAFFKWWMMSQSQSVDALMHAIWIANGCGAGILLGFVLGAVWRLATRVSASSRGGRSGQTSGRTAK